MYGTRNATAATAATAEVYNLLGWHTELIGKNIFDI
jgi:hypothetical protein